MFKCEECGEVFETPNRWSETGLPYATLTGCPKCGGYYEEAEQCKVCKDWHLPSKMYSGVCVDCLAEHGTYDMCKSIFEGETENMNVDCLAYFILGEEKINQILKDYIEKELPKADCSEIIMDNKTWFAEKLIEEMKGKR